MTKLVAALALLLNGCVWINCIGGTPAEKPYYCSGSTQQPPVFVDGGVKAQ